MNRINTSALFRRIDGRIAGIELLQSREEKKALIIDIINNYCSDKNLKEPIINEEDYVFLTNLVDNDLIYMDQGEELMALQHYIDSIIEGDEIGIKQTRLYFEK